MVVSTEARPSKGSALPLVQENRGVSDAREAIRALLGLARSATGLRVGILVRVDITTRSVVIIDAFDETDGDIARSLSLHANALGFGHLAYKGESICEGDISRHPVLRKILLFSELDVRSYIGVPVKTNNGGVWGTLAVMDTRKRELSKNELDAMMTVAKLIAFEIEREERLAALRAQTQLLTHRIAAAQAADEEHLRAVRLQTVLEAAATVSHEVNNPLAVLQLRINRLAKRATDAETADDLAAMSEAANEINQVTVRLRSVVRPVSTRYVSGKATMLDLAASVEALAPKHDEQRSSSTRKIRKRREPRTRS